MKRVIRQSVYETNSSSSHVIVITKDDHMCNTEDIGTSYVEDNLNKEIFYINTKGEWEIWNEDDLSFQRWPLQFLTTVEDKARYAIANYCGEYTGYSDNEKVEFINKLTKMLQEIAPELESIKLPMQDRDRYVDVDGNPISSDEYVHRDRDSDNELELKYCYEDDDGVKHEAIYDYTEEWPNVPGIDHQSDKLLENFLRDKGISLREFLLNRKYIVVIDGDEYDEFSKIMNSALINKDNIEEIYDEGE